MTIGNTTTGNAAIASDITRGQSIFVPATTASVHTPTPTVAGTGTATIQPPATTASATTPPLTLAATFTLAIPPTTATATTPAPTVAAGESSVTISASTASATTPTPTAAGVGDVTVATPTASVQTTTPGLRFNVWTVGGEYIGRRTGERATYSTLELSVRAGRDEITTLRPLERHAGDVDRLVLDDGTWRAKDRASGDNTYSVRPPPHRAPLRTDGDVLVDAYDEELVSDQGDAYDVTVTFVVDGSRSTSETASETGDWTLDIGDQTIATDRIHAEILGIGADGVERVELTGQFTLTQAAIIEGVLSDLDATRIREIPDGSNLVVDETSDERNTVGVTSPENSVVASDDYVVLDWQSELTSRRFQQVRLVLGASV